VGAAQGSGQSRLGVHLFPPFGRLALDPHLFHPQQRALANNTGANNTGAKSGNGGGSGAATGAVAGESPHYGRGVGLVDPLGAPHSWATSGSASGGGLALSALEASALHDAGAPPLGSLSDDDTASFLGDGSPGDGPRHPRDLPPLLLAVTAPPPVVQPPFEVVDEIAFGRPVSGGAGSSSLRGGGGRLFHGRGGGGGAAQYAQQSQPASFLRTTTGAHRALAGPTSAMSTVLKQAGPFSSNSGPRPASADGELLRHPQPAPMPHAMGSIVNRAPTTKFFGAQRSNPAATAMHQGTPSL
jgi:hypothetical protein